MQGCEGEGWRGTTNQIEREREITIGIARNGTAVFDGLFPARICREWFQFVCHPSSVSERTNACDFFCRIIVA